MNTKNICEINSMWIQKCSKGERERKEREEERERKKETKKQTKTAKERERASAQNISVLIEGTNKSSVDIFHFSF